MANDAHGFIRKLLADRYGEAAAALIRILYGGSVTPAGAPGLFRMEEIDGGLVGGASLVLNDFLAIAEAAGGGAP
jgi:triosephosphate isomerase